MELGLYYVNRNSSSKFQVIILKDETEKLRKFILAKANNSSESMSNATKFEFDLYNVNSTSYTKFQVNVSKDTGEKSGKLNFSKGQYLL